MRKSAIMMFCFAVSSFLTLSCQKGESEYGQLNSGAVDPNLKGKKAVAKIADLIYSSRNILKSLYRIDDDDAHLLISDTDVRVDTHWLMQDLNKIENADNLSLDQLIDSMRRLEQPYFNVAIRYGVRQRLVRAANPDEVFAVGERYFGPARPWPSSVQNNFVTKGQYDRYLSDSWNSILSSAVSDRPDNPGFLARYLDDQYIEDYVRKGYVYSENLEQLNKLSSTWSPSTVTKLKSEGWVNTSLLIYDPKDPTKKKNKPKIGAKNEPLILQTSSYGLHVNPKGGDLVHFMAPMDCYNSVWEWKENNTSFPSVSISLSIQEIEDGATAIAHPKTRRVFRTKKAYGWFSPTILGKNPRCLIGTSVYSKEGNLYGIITDYLPENGRELGTNLVITSVVDERLIYLFKYWMAPYNGMGDQSYRAPVKTSYRPTAYADVFDPKFLQSLDSTHKMSEAVLHRIDLDRCAGPFTPEEAFRKEVNRLSHARSQKFPQLRTPKLPTTSSQLNCKCPIRR